MPTYEYRCPSGHDFEHFVLKISEASSELPCPECGKLATRLISAGAGLVFKGSGFYITDYGKDGKKDQRDRVAKQQSEAAKMDAAKGEGARSEARSEAKGELKSEGAKSEAKGEGARSEGAKGESKPAVKPEPKKADAAPASPKKGGKE